MPNERKEQLLIETNLLRFIFDIFVCIRPRTCSADIMYVLRRVNGHISRISVDAKYTLSSVTSSVCNVLYFKLH